MLPSIYIGGCRRHAADLVATGLAEASDFKFIKGRMGWCDNEIRDAVDAHDWLVLEEGVHATSMAVLGNKVTADDLKTVEGRDMCSLVRYPAWQAALEHLGTEYSGFSVLAREEEALQQEFKIE